MYVITKHHEEFDEVLLGPVDWNHKFIASALSADLDIPITLLPSDKDRVPFDIIDNVRVRTVETVYEDLNPRTQRHEGPYWAYTDEVGTATYTAVDKGIEQVKGELKNITSSQRYKKEVSGASFVFESGEKVFISTDRAQRIVYTSGVPGQWKFVKVLDTTITDFVDGEEVTKTVEVLNGEVWINLTELDLTLINDTIKAHVQTAFDWEASKHQAIDACSSLTELNNIEI